MLYPFFRTYSLTNKTFLLLLIGLPLILWQPQEARGSNFIQLNLNGDTLKVDSYAHLSMDLVKAVRDGDPYEHITQMLAEVSSETLREDLRSESHNKAFWLNIYNAYIQILLLDQPELFKDRNSWFGYNFFSSPQVTIAGQKLSFDDIEHGIMRRSKIKISMGYLNRWFVDDFIKTFWWEEAGLHSPSMGIRTGQFTSLGWSITANKSET